MGRWRMAWRVSPALTMALGLAVCDQSDEPDQPRPGREANAEPAAAAVVARPVTPMIAVAGAETSFAVETGAELELGLRLATPGGRVLADVTDVDIDPFTVRLPGGRIDSVARDEVGGFRYTFAEPGAAVVAMCARAEHFTSCGKTILAVVGGQPGPMLTDVTAKHGTPVELRPLGDHRTYRTGNELAVRVYLGGEKRKGAAVEAHRPDGSTVVRTANAGGTVRLALDQAGPWVIRFREREGDHHYQAELAFSVAGEAR